VSLLAELLTRKNFSVIIDQLATAHRKDWGTWAPKAIVTSDFTLMIASPDYKKAADGFDDSTRNRGVQSEAAVIRDQLHGDRSRWERKLLPVLLPGHAVEEIPYFMQPYSADWYRIKELTDEGIEDLLNVLTAQPEHRPGISSAPTHPAHASPGDSEPRWRPLKDPLEVTWRADLFGGPGTLAAALELHLVPVDGERLTMSRLQRIPDMLAAQGRTRLFFTAAEALEVNWSERAAWAHSIPRMTGLAVFRTGQRTAWVPLIKAQIGYIINREYARDKITQMLILLSGLDLPPAAVLAPSAGLEPLNLVREAPAHDATSNSASMSHFNSPPIRLACEESLTREELVSSAEAVADELAARILAPLHNH
jgi:hypothetical protein